ncbi:DNA phosphorothioation system sulfurtransferase DndC [Campylobacter hyointestinalis subsp. lawsonii]|nr:DNA phosphorothioation system sulfurtransferase DndC [Campylobacter hyointestinalis subsp. lawsonii]
MMKVGGGTRLLADLRSIIIDIRPKQSYLSYHIANSVNLTTKDDILNFINHNDYEEYILCCTSSIKAKALANEIHLANVKYYDGNLLDAKADGAIFVSSSDEFFTILNQTKDKILDLYTRYRRAWIVAFSGGKDSTCVLQLIYDMMIKLPKDRLNPTYAILSDTLVESPNIKEYLYDIVKAINEDAKRRNIPFEIIITKPKPIDEFWVNLIGKGYPSPTRTFRWCTERLKIKPMKEIVKQITDKYGSAIMTLGVRKSESTNRKRSIEKRNLSEDGLSKHDDYQNVLIFSPIVQWDTDMVWNYLISQNPSPWGKSHNKLFELYTQANGDECQFIIDKNQNSCGGSRFGCWVCTLVNEDKSMQGFIKNGHKELSCLNKFRDYIKAARDNPDMRSDFKKDGRYQKGPFTSAARKEILNLLLKCESEFKANGGCELISDEQLMLIAKEWSREFDSSNQALKIAKEYGRAMDIQIIQDEKLPDEDLVCGLDDQLTNTAKSIIKETLYLQNQNNGVSDRELIGIIEKYLNEMTAKL